METVQKEFFDWFCSEFGFIGGENAFMNRLPNTNQTGQSTPVVWVLENNGFVTRQFTSKTKQKEYNLVVNYRAAKAKDVDEAVLEFEQVINHLTCFELPSYKVVSIQADSFNSDLDADAEGFYRGTVSITINIIDNYEIQAEPPESS